MVLLIFLLLSVFALSAAEPPAVQKMLKLFADLNEAQSTKRKVQFQFSEGEINEYLQYARVANPRPGLDRMNVKFFPGNYISTFTVIDFDMVERLRPGTVPSLLRPVLKGKKEIWIDLRVNADNGFGTFAIEKAYFESIRLPAFLVESMIHVVAAKQKEQFDTSKPVALPFGLRSVVIGEKSVAGQN